MRFIWNGMCDPTLHVIAIALLLAGIVSQVDLDGSSLRDVGPIKKCLSCSHYHYNQGAHCDTPRLTVASQDPRD